MTLAQPKWPVLVKQTILVVGIEPIKHVKYHYAITKVFLQEMGFIFRKIENSAIYRQ